MPKARTHEENRLNPHDEDVSTDQAVSDLIFVDKPAGATTHSSLNEKPATDSLIDPNDGFVEYLSARSGIDLRVAHRLDRETTGALCFARTAQAAEKLREVFASRSVEKRYLFLTDRKSSRSELEVESHISRGPKGVVSATPTNERAANAHTKFILLEESHGLSLWEARPLTGRTHQIRLHAASSGIPILGDTLYGGSNYPSLCLHSHALSFEIDGQKYSQSFPEPRWFRRRELAQDPILSRWLSAIDRRERLLRSWKAVGSSSDQPSTGTLRWIHSEGDPLRADQLGSVIHFSWFADQEPSESEWKSIRRLCEELGWENWYLQVRGNRGRSPNEEKIIRGTKAEFENRWIGEENGLRFEFRTDTGLSPGLFLDQRRNRLWVKENASGKSVLNLFSYTGGFSVAAAVGGAARVVSVDVSRQFIEWSKTNFALNSIPLEPHEFRVMDSREYLAWAAKKGHKFDLVICDPPSFSRSKTGGVFRIEKDFEVLLDQLNAVTRPGGRILFAMNFEGWTVETFAKRLNKWLAKTKAGRLKRTPTPDWDFELPDTDRQMKSAFIEKA